MEKNPQNANQTVLNWAIFFRRRPSLALELLEIIDGESFVYSFLSDSAPLALLDESQIKDLIYEVRGQTVMLDFDLAKIYGYGTSAVNQQIMKNLDRFPEDFSFQLTKQEFESILLSHFVTSSWGGRRGLPRAFTEQGIYMLMTVLHDNLAIEQGITLIRLFRSMKDYIAETQSLSSANEVLSLANQVRTNTESIAKIGGKSREEGRFDSLRNGNPECQIDE